MPQTDIIYFRESGGRAPIVEWLKQLRTKDRRGFEKCAERIQRLGRFGYELRRPVADSLRDGIHELRARRGSVHYRILYFFHGRNVAVLAHALTKKTDQVPPVDIDVAVARGRAFAQDLEKHSYYWQEADDAEED